MASSIRKEGMIRVIELSGSVELKVVTSKYLGKNTKEKNKKIYTKHYFKVFGKKIYQISNR